MNDWEIEVQTIVTFKKVIGHYHMEIIPSGKGSYRYFVNNVETEMRGTLEEAIEDCYAQAKQMGMVVEKEHDVVGVDLIAPRNYAKGEPMMLTKEAFERLMRDKG